MRTGSSSAGHLTILMSFVQIAAIELGSVSRALDWLQFANLRATSTHRCLAPLSPLQQQFLTFLTPFILMVVLLVICIGHFLLYQCGTAAASSQPPPRLPTSESSFIRRQYHTVTTTFSVHSYIGCAMSILLFSYISVTIAVIESLDCVDITSGVRLRFSQPTVDCNSHEYRAFLPVVLVLLSVCHRSACADGRIPMATSTSTSHQP
jgi:hypothetical protein